MASPRDTRLNSRLAALVLVFLVSFSVYGLYCINTVSEVKISGTAYQRIIEGKDLIADVLPPPAYLIETYLTAYLMLDAEGPEELAALVARLRRLATDFETRQAVWSRVLAEGELKRAMTVEAFEPGKRMLAALEEDFVPALRAGNPDQARTVLELTVSRDYALHRRAVDRVVELASARHHEAEAAAAMSVKSRTYGQVTLGLGLFAFLSLFSAWLIRKGDPERIGSGEADTPQAHMRLNSDRGQNRTAA